jgi:hypothetical protein
MTPLHRPVSRNADAAMTYEPQVNSPGGSAPA